MSSAFPDLTDVTGEAEQYVAHPDFDRAMHSFCRGLADFHSVAVARRAGIVDTVTWAVALLVLYLDEHAPESANASQLVAICAEVPRRSSPGASSASSSSSSSSFASWRSRFFGVGPRVAVTGGVPIQGAWSFEYSGGLAALVGDRSFNITMSNSAGAAFAANYSNTVFVFNADGFAALSYRFTPNLKASVGIRADYYNSALKTYNVNTGGIASLDRVYWGPFVRLSGSFGP